MTRIKICWILFTFSALILAMPQPELVTLDSFIRQIRQLERKPSGPVDFVKQAEAALHSTGKILTLIDWAYETNITEFHKTQKLAFKVCELNCTISKKKYVLEANHS